MRHRVVTFGFGLAVLGGLVLLNLLSLYTLREVQASRAVLLSIQQLSLTHASLRAPTMKAGKQEVGK